MLAGKIQSTLSYFEFSPTQNINQHYASVKVRRPRRETEHRIVRIRRDIAYCANRLSGQVVIPQFFEVSPDDHCRIDVDNAIDTRWQKSADQQTRKRNSAHMR